ncbi:MAG TPA: hypothetical protein VEB66_00235 [Opitutaceae bacterium]|nr:hypothetical protein [Opitutaceae bacterium]
MKAFWTRRSRRERALILVFVTIGALIWTSSAAGRFGDRWRERRRLGVEAAAQAVWLEQKDAIEARAVQAASSLDPARTLDATELVGEVSAMAGRAGLEPAVEPPRSERSGQFAYHTVQVNVRGAGLAEIVAFYRELAGRAPYLALRECALNADRADPTELDAMFLIFSVEVPK